MSRYLILTKALLKNTSNPFAVDSKKKTANVIITLLIFLSLMPMMGGLGTLVWGAYGAFAQLGQQGLVLGIGFSAVSFAIFFFGIFYVINVFYFSKDVENLLPLPFKPFHILGAKFTITLIYEYLTEIIFLLPIIIVYGYRSGAGFIYYFYGLIIFLLLPIVPLAAASIIDMIIMRFTNIAKNKDRFKIFGGIIAIFLALGINFYSQSYSKVLLNPKKLQELVLSGNNSLLQIMTTLFPSSKFAAFTMVNSGSGLGFVNLLLFLGFVFLTILVYIFLGNVLYFGGVIGMSEAASRRHELGQSELNKSTIQSSALKTLTLKELRILFRTPIYFINCILLNFLWPVFLIVPLFMQSGSLQNISKISEFANSQALQGTILALSFAFSTFIASSNCITSTAISREGQNIFVNKYIPADYMTQIMAKVLSGVLMGIVGMLMLLIVAIFLIKPSMLLVSLICIVSLLGIIFSSFIGMIIDLNFPKLLWENEQKAVKQNFNVVISMLICVAIGGAAAFLIFITKANLWTSFLGITIVFSIIDVLLYKMLSSRGRKLIEQIEV